MSVHDEVTSSTNQIPDASLCPEQQQLKRDEKEEDKYGDMVLFATWLGKVR